MDLPAELRRGLEAALAGASTAALREASARLSERYRGEVRDGRFHLADDLSVRAYLASRMPATYAAVRASFAAVAEVLPGFAPASLIDVGAGSGTALWAARDAWPALASADLVESSPAASAIGQTLASEVFAGTTWHRADVSSDLPDLAKAGLVTAAYLLGELRPAVRGQLVERLWALTDGALVIVEPGTSAGWERILAARAQLIAAGARIVAPCPHGLACPLALPDWCHFSERLPRSRIHRQAKDAELSYEDEKYIYVAASRTAGLAPAPRVIARPQPASGHVRLKLCQPDGTAENAVFSRRQGAAYKTARRAGWGDRLAI